MYPNFKWWTGIVEDRADPGQLGRCRVRIIGYHTDNKDDLPTTALPWSVPVMPLTSASISGVGETPGLVEGTTVFGFFSDGEDEQVPIIIGSIPGKPRNKRKTDKGFSDPRGVYPREGESGLNGLQEPDLSRLARNAVAEGHASLINKRASRFTHTPVAVAPHVDSIQPDKSGVMYERTRWEEPHPRFGDTATGDYNAPNQKPNLDGKTSVYPYNKVTETETGHVFEVDDTPNNGRIHEYHNAGTFYEIQADGTKITKVVGDEYEITLKDKKVYINGSCDVTIAGDATMLVMGDKYEEVSGNVFTTVYGDRITKIVGNDMTEVLSGQSTNVTRSTSFRSGGDHTNTIVGNNTESVGGNKFATVGGSSSSHVLKSTSMISGLGVKILSATGNMKLLAPIGTLKTVSLNMSLKATLNQTITGTVQLIEAKSLQTLSSLGAQVLTSTAQQTVAPARSIIGNTTHTGNYTVIGVASGTIVRQGAIVLGTHKHPANMTPPVP